MGLHTVPESRQLPLRSPPPTLEFRHFGPLDAVGENVVRALLAGSGGLPLEDASPGLAAAYRSAGRQEAAAPCTSGTWPPMLHAREARDKHIPRLLIRLVPISIGTRRGASSFIACGYARHCQPRPASPLQYSWGVDSGRRHLGMSTVLMHVLADSHATPSVRFGDGDYCRVPLRCQSVCHALLAQ